MKLNAQIEVRKAWAEAFSKYTGAVVPDSKLVPGLTEMVTEPLALWKSLQPKRPKTFHWS